MAHRISLPVFALTYLPATMLAAGCTTFALFAFSIATRMAAPICGLPLVAGGVVACTFVLSGLPMLSMGIAACGSRRVGGAPIWGGLMVIGVMTLRATGGCVGVLPQAAPAPEMVLALPVAFATVSFAVFLRGVWRLTRPTGPATISSFGA
ncbi:hypothetical protein [Jannaschia donghaensis]|uniref:Uncharacterized protein n=1 Tax=Jannaschia donghaensis TaxID=420998 RepID=A0A0M6YN64_9RHOB|nr:hypothetical protein [Jannaschia donghaensis]CTQ51095.1 hypothetical protein JDO7802_03133 [Jannaschia donghaensis]